MMSHLLKILFALLLIENIVECNELKYEIYEEMASKTQIGNVARDSNLGMVVSNLTDLRYNLLTQGNPHSLLFLVDETSGDLSNSRLLDRELICSFMDNCDLVFEVIVQSYLGSFFRKISVIVTLLDINDNAPEFLKDDFTLEVSEDVVIGSVFPLPTAVDKDTAKNNSVQTYELLNHSNVFSIVTHEVFGGNVEASLKVIRTLDREKVKSYKLTVIAKDKGSPPKSGSLSLTVNIRDVNDNYPLFEYPSYSVNISETLKLNGLIVRIQASDSDIGENANVSYQFTPRQPETLLRPFFLNSTSGELRLVSPLESSAGKTYRLSAEAKDKGNPSLSTQVQIDVHVLDTHNNPPEVHVNTFSSSGAAEVSESSSLGRAVVHIGVHDPDSGANGLVNCSTNHDYIQLSQLDVNEYKGILTKPLDRETSDEHSVIVVCYDSGTPQLTTSVRFQVKVLDENDNAPVFLQKYYKASISENNFIPQFIISISAVDYDVGSNAEIVYGLIGQNKEDFKMAKNGTLYAAKQFDREVEPVVYATVIATDNGQKKLTSTATVEITLKDQNDKRPEFKYRVFRFNVPENMPPGKSVGKIEAFDRDAGKNAEIAFSMETNDGFPFSSTQDGVILTTKELDRETTKSYTFNVVATDKGKDPLSSTVQIVVYVDDTNDQSPVILFPSKGNNTFTIPHSYRTNTGFSSILAYDLDAGVNSKVRYFIKKGISSDFFQVHELTGEIATAKEFQEHELGIYHIVVGARDQGTPPLTAYSDLYVEVYHANVTLSNSSVILSKKNMITVAVLVCTTIILGLIVVLVMFFMRRRDKQKRIYNAKSEENRVIAMMSQAGSESGSDGGINNSSINIQISPTQSLASSAKKEVSFSLDDENNMCFDSDMELCTAAGKSTSRAVDKTSRELQDEGKGDVSSVMSDAVSASDSGRGGSDVDVSSQTITQDSDVFYSQTGIMRDSSKRHFPILSDNPPHSYCVNYHQTTQSQRQSGARPPAYNAEHGRQWRSRNTSKGSGPKSFDVQKQHIQERKNMYSDKKDDTSIYVEMKAPFKNSPNLTQFSVLEESSNDAFWDNDTTTTSGSYTIDAEELCEEIDQLFFKESEDIIV